MVKNAGTVALKSGCSGIYSFKDLLTLIQRMQGELQKLVPALTFPHLFLCMQYSGFRCLKQ